MDGHPPDVISGDRIPPTDRLTVNILLTSTYSPPTPATDRKWNPTWPGTEPRSMLSIRARSVGGRLSGSPSSLLNALRGRNLTMFAAPLDRSLSALHRQGEDRS